MRKILAIDTSTEVCSVCLADGDRIAGEYASRSAITHTERLVPAIDLLMRHVGWKQEDLSGIAVIHGPGSFTGLRIGLSTAKGLAMGLQIPVVSASALEIAAMQVADEGWICPAMDARRGQIFTGLFRREKNRLEEIKSPVSIEPEVWMKELPDAPVVFCGPGAALYWNRLKNHESSTIGFEDFILAPMLAVFALKKMEAGEVIGAAQLKAAYLRPSDAEIHGPHRRKKLAHIPQR